MANPLIRLLSQIGLSVATVFGKAFSKAYKNAAAEAAEAKRAGRVGSGSSAEVGSGSGWLRSQMRPDEAYKVLNVDPKSATPREDIERSYEKLFRINDVAAGGSFYLQSKVFRAKQTLDRIHKPPSAQQTQRQPAADAAQHSAASPSSSSASSSAAAEQRRRPSARA